MTYSVYTTMCDSFVNKILILLNPKSVEITFKNSVRTSKRTPNFTITKINYLIVFWSRVSSGSIVYDYGLDDRAIGVRSLTGAKDFSSSLCVQTGSGAHPASCTMGTGGPFPGDKSAAGA
jgi:hypothetical protein